MTPTPPLPADAPMQSPLAALVPEWHPILPSPGEAEVRAYIEANGIEKFAQFIEARERALRLAQWDKDQPLATDPFTGGLDLPHWLDADFVLKRDKTYDELVALRDMWLRAPYVQALPEKLKATVGILPRTVLALVVNLLILLGGNRSGKSEYCADRTVQSAMDNPGSLIVCVSGVDMDQSRENMQKLIWKYLPRWIKQLSGKRDQKGIFHVNYSQKGGFTLDKVILPNGSTILFFASQTQEAGVLEGKMLGHSSRRCVGFWADEDVVLPWMLKLITRANYYNAIGYWSFTPVDGMTPAIKQLVGEAQTLMSLPAEWLSQERKHVPDCPNGEMPYLQLPRTPQTAVMYFHTQLSPFGSGLGKDFRTFYEALKVQHRDAGDAVKAKFAYGYTTDTSGRKFPGFTSVNVVPRPLIPEVGTLRRWVDPHGRKPYAHVWTLTTPGDPPTHYAVREWPDERHYGPWAVSAVKTDATSNKWKDGEPGDASKKGLGWGVLEYKLMWREKERIIVPPQVRAWAKKPAEERKVKGALDAFLREHIETPWHRPYIRKALLGGGALDELFEHVEDCYMDPRFCNAEYADAEGTTCLRFKFEEDHTDPATGQRLPRCDIMEAAGKDLEHGYSLVTELLAWNRNHPDGFVPGINAPHYYVMDECTQTRWAFENFTGLAGQAGACKEWMDLARWLAEAEPMHVTEGMFNIRSAAECGGEEE